MKRTLLFLAVVIGLGLPGAGLRSQDAAPEAAPAPAPTPIPPIAKGTPLEMLRAMRDANAKIIEQQAATLQKLEEMEKISQTLKVLGKRS
jgi:hypothetical protein